MSCFVSPQPEDVFNKDKQECFTFEKLESEDFCQFHFDTVHSKFGHARFPVSIYFLLDLLEETERLELVNPTAIHFASPP